MTHRFVRSLESIMTGHAFAAFMIGVLSFSIVFLVTMLLLPVAETPWGAFVSDFKEWCFSWDPATGQYNRAYAAVMILNPLMLIGIVAAVWWEPLRTAASSERRSLGRTTGAAFAVVMLLVGGLWMLGPDTVPQQELPFPAERLRTAMETPAFALRNQAGDELELAELRGRVVLVTAVYATCHTACPTILTHVKRTVAALEPELREKLTVVAITLDPQNDTPERLANTARAHELEAPLYNLVNGDDPAVIEALLDAFSFARIRNPETGEIDHANMFVLIDGDQRIAYRLTLGTRHQNWLETALRVLLREV